MMKERVLYCQSCGRQLGVYKENFLCIKHRGREINIPYNRDTDVVATIKCEFCKRTSPIYGVQFLAKK